MAGVGFKLEAQMMNGSPIGRMLAGVSTACIAAGPALSAIFGMILLGPVLRIVPPGPRLDLFYGAATIGFLIATLCSALWEVVVQRYTADMIYLRSYETLSATYLAAAGFSITASSSLAAIVYWVSGIPLVDVGRLVLLVAVISLGRVAMVFLSVSSATMTISVSVFLGTIFGVATAVILDRRGVEGFEAATIGMIAGQGSMALVLSRLVIACFPSRCEFPFEIAVYFRKQARYILIGFGATLGLWVDKLIYWFAPGIGIEVRGLIRTTPHYDFSAMIGYLTTIPALGFFIVKVETGVFIPLRTFLSMLERKARYDLVEFEQRHLQREARRAVTGLFWCFCLTGLGVAGALPLVLPAFGFSPALLPLAFVSIAAIGLNVQALLVQTLVLYLNQSRAVLWLTILHLVATATLTLVFLKFARGSLPLGVGYLLASGIVYGMSVVVFFRLLARLSVKVMGDYAADVFEKSRDRAIGFGGIS